MSTNKQGGIRFLFILSTERSGSTLLSLMLGGHSHVISPPELHLMAYSTVDEWLQRYPTAMKSLDFLLASCGLKMDRKRFEEQFAGWATESLYGWIVAQRSDDPLIIVDKTPKYARDLTALHRTATLDPYYIWPIRHPLGVATSKLALRLERRKQRNTDFVSRLKYPLFRIRGALRKREDLFNEVAYWTRVNAQVDQFLGTIRPDRQYRIQFKQLVNEPQAVIERVCRWLAIPFDSAMLDPQAHIPGALDRTLGDPKVKRQSTIDPKIAGSWRELYSEELLAPSTREAMARWGIT